MSEGVEYRDIEGFPDYRVGSDGTVWSRRVKGLKGAVGKWHRLKARLWSGRYAVIGLRAKPGGKVRTLRVHRLVLEAFVGPCPAGTEACHNDGDPLNNRLDNLRWDTPKANTADKERHGTMRRGEAHPCARLTEPQVRRIHAMRAEGLEHKAIAREFGVAASTVGEILRGERWHHLKTNGEEA